MKNLFLLKLQIIILFIGFSSSIQATNKTGIIIPINELALQDTIKPLIKDFIGINGHFHFQPDLYGQVCRLVRNYHNVNWDVEKPGDDITLPVCVNKVNWEEHVYKPWKEKGFETDICIQFSGFAPPEPDYKAFWIGQEDWMYRYGKAMAAFYGPSGDKKLCTSMEIGNEPGSRFDSTLYKVLFTNMARGIRDGDPQMKILTPTVHARKGDDYNQSLNSIYKDKEVLPLYDIINVHIYADIPALAPGESPWNRTYPEDMMTNYLRIVDETIEWRNKNAPDKDIWITEFGYDACTPDAMEKRTGWALELDWQGVSDLQQAQYIIRSFFLFAARNIGRAYIYYYNDEDEPGVHASAGLTRNFQPKMSFWAVKQLYELLGEYRFSAIIQQPEANVNSVYVHEFSHGENPDRKIWAVWSPTGVASHKKDGYIPKILTTSLQNIPGNIIEVIPMSTSQFQDKGNALEWKMRDGAIELTVSESPTYILFSPDN
ncbi:MAG: hypothetical protein LBV43_12345 [Prevotella sp.]|jgi:hypothetical protein|nr:hypothetical protein [Prevotella sp.]